MSTWCFCNIIINRLVMHCPSYPPRVDVESRAASKIILGNRLWNISAPGVQLVVSAKTRSRSGRSTFTQGKSNYNFTTRIHMYMYENYRGVCILLYIVFKVKEPHLQELLV